MISTIEILIKKNTHEIFNELSTENSETQTLCKNIWINEKNIENNNILKGEKMEDSIKELKTKIKELEEDIKTSIIYVERYREMLEDVKKIIKEEKERYEAFSPQWIALHKVYEKVCG